MESLDERVVFSFTTPDNKVKIGINDTKYVVQPFQHSAMVPSFSPLPMPLKINQPTSTPQYLKKLPLTDSGDIYCSNSSSESDQINAPTQITRNKNTNKKVITVNDKGAKVVNDFQVKVHPNNQITMRQVYQKQGGHQQEVIIEEMDQDIQQLKDSRKI